MHRKHSWNQDRVLHPKCCTAGRVHASFGSFFFLLNICLFVWFFSLFITSHFTACFHLYRLFHKICDNINKIKFEVPTVNFFSKRKKRCISFFFFVKRGMSFFMNFSTISFLVFCIL
jgi:hypothetical protein